MLIYTIIENWVDDTYGIPQNNRTIIDYFATKELAESVLAKYPNDVVSLLSSIDYESGDEVWKESLRFEVSQITVKE